MRIKLVLPNKIMLDTEAKKVTAPGRGGSFQLLPRHIDVVWTLEPGILVVTQQTGDIFYAIDRGVLVKQGEMVFVSCFQAIKGDSLEALNRAVDENFRQLNETEKKARKVLIKLEADTVRRFIELE